MPSRPIAHVAALVSLLIAAMHVGSAHAQEEGPAFKFTTGLYHVAGGPDPAGWGLDLNLRHTSAIGNTWVGGYTAPSQHLRQARAGWDRTFEVGPVRVQPSVQWASGGFVGGSLSAEAGEEYFVGAGIGRTNLRPYVNLNFDPNDAWMLSAGRRWAGGRSLALLLVHDNRQNPDQRHFHVTFRTPAAQGERLTLDLLLKAGTVDGTFIRRAGFSAGYDWPRHFVRVAWDPKVNFTNQDMVRVAGGLRF